MFALQHVGPSLVLSTPTATMLPALSATQPRVTPLVADTEVPQSCLLETEQVPSSDPYDLAKRLRHVTTPVQRSTPATPIRYSIGDQDRFWIMNLDDAQIFQVNATLRYISPHLYLWVQDDVSIERDALERSAQTFEQRIYRGC